MTMFEAVSSVLSKYATFNGRARRSEYWFWTLAVCIASLVASLADMSLGGTFVQAIVAVATFVPYLAVGARRLHDIDRSGWLQLIGLIPLVGWIFLIILFATDSQPANKYGPNPKADVLGAYGTPPAV